MVAVVRNSILVGFRELRAAAIVVSPVVLLAYLVMKVQPSDLVVVVGIPMFCVFAMNQILFRIRIYSTRKDQAQPSHEQPPKKDVPRGRMILSVILVLGTLASLMWAIAFLISAPFYAALNVSPWTAVKGFGVLIAVFLIFLASIILAAILQTWKFSVLVRKLFSFVKTMAFQSSDQDIISLVRHYDASSSDIRHT